MKIVLPLVLFFFLAAVLPAQENETRTSKKEAKVPAYYLKASGDTVRGSLVVQLSTEQKDSVHLFKLQQRVKFHLPDGSTQKFRPNASVTEIGFWHRNTLRRMHLVDCRKVVRSGIYIGKCYMYLQRSVSGPLEVYTLLYGINQTFGEYDVILHKRGTRWREKASKTEGKRKLRKYVKDCPAAAQYLESHEFITGDNYFVELAKAYNENCK